MRRFFRLIVLFVLAGIGMLPTMLRAQQWNLIAPFPSSVSSIYFLDAFGAPDTGFAGTTNGIYQTINGGAIWHLCPNTTGLIIRDFTFKDADTGWAIASNAPIVAKTTNAGATWTQLTAPNAGTTLRYAAQTNTLFMSYPNGGSAVESTDEGQTWTQIPVPSVNGIAFADGASGVWSSHGVFPLYYTSDGGVNWLPSNLTHHIFSPTSLGSSHSYFGASEYDDSCYLSTDGGVRWTFRGMFTGPALSFSGTAGCVQFHNGNLWTQSISDGMFLSRDTGLTWIPLCGPSGQVDSRFYARGTTLFAASASMLYEDPDGTIPPPPASLACAPDTLALRAPRCGSANILVTLALSAGCYLELDSVYVTDLRTGTAQTGSKNFSADQLILPDPLGSIDFGVYYHDGGQQFDTAYLHLVWRAGGILKDSIVTVYGSVGGVAQTLSLPMLSKMQAATCTTIDTSILITSIACDTLDILSAYLTDTTLFHLNRLLLPLQLQPKASLGVRIRGMFQHPGVYSDSLHITIRYGTAHTVKDTIVGISVHVSGVTRPAVADLTLRTANGCQSIDTVLHVENLHCLAGTLDSAISGDPTVSVASDTAFPILLPTDSLVPIRIHVQPPKSGSALIALTLHFDIDSTRIDTVIYVTVITTAYPNPRPVFSQSKIAFGPSSLCFQKQAAFLFQNAQCDTMQLTRIRWSYPDSEFSFDSVIVPLVLAPDETDTMLFHYKPTAARSDNATLTLTFTLNGHTQDTILQLTGSGTDAATSDLTPDTLAFPAITKCTAALDSTTFINTSCDTLVLNSIRDLSPSGFHILSPNPGATQIKLAPGDSISIVVSFVPGANGSYADSIDVIYHSTAAPGSDLTQRLRLAGRAATSFTPAELVGANFTNIHLAACSELDTSFTIRNLNSCDSISIDSIVANQAGFILTPALPLTLIEDSSVTFHLHFTPDQDTEQARIHLIGINLDTTIAIAIFRARTDSVSFSPMSALPFAARPCRAVSERFILFGGGLCDSIEVDSLMLSSAGTKFSLSATRATPFTLNGTDTITATYDPNLAGLDSTELIVTSAGGKLDLHLPLVGSIPQPTPVAQCAILLDGTSRDTVPAGRVATLTLRALDAIPDSLGLAEVTFDLDYNDNILTKLQLNAAPGFSAGAIQSSLSSSTRTLSLQFLRNSNIPIAAGDPIGSVDFLVTVGDTLSTPVAMRNLRFNPSDSTFEECTLSALAAVDTAYLTVANACGTPLLEENLRSNLLVFGIQPTIVTGGDARATQINIDLSLKSASMVSARLFTTDGEELARVSEPLAPGRQTLPLELTRIPRGVAFIEISDGSEKYVRKVVLE